MEKTTLMNEFSNLFNDRVSEYAEYRQSQNPMDRIRTSYELPQKMRFFRRIAENTLDEFCIEHDAETYLFMAYDDAEKQGGGLYKVLTQLVGYIADRDAKKGK